MKKLLAILMMSSLLLSGCSAKEEKPEPPVEVKPEIESSSTYAVFAEPEEDDLLILVNQPTEKQLEETNIHEGLELYPGGESVLLIPKEEGTYIQIWDLRYENDELRRNDLVYHKDRTEKDYVLEMQLNRPDTIPQYMMIVESPRGYSEYLFSDNLKDGLPNIERIKTTKVTAKDNFAFHEMGYMFTYSRDELVTILGEPEEESDIPFFDDMVATRLSYDDCMFEIDEAVYFAIVANDEFAHPRGIKIGDSMEEVIAKFPNEGNDTKYPYDGEDREYSMLYGDYAHMQEFGMIEYVSGIPVCITYSQEASALVVELSNGEVMRIRYEIPLT